LASIEKRGGARNSSEVMVKTRKEDEKFVTSLLNSGNRLHKKVGKSFHIFAECTKNWWVCSNVYLAEGV
jgi:hypothetical protein